MSAQIIFSETMTAPPPPHISKFKRYFFTPTLSLSKSLRAVQPATGFSQSAIYTAWYKYIS
jgi:hypothetical protein